MGWLMAQISQFDEKEGRRKGQGDRRKEGARN